MRGQANGGGSCEGSRRGSWEGGRAGAVGAAGGGMHAPGGAQGRSKGHSGGGVGRPALGRPPVHPGARAMHARRSAGNGTPSNKVYTSTTLPHTPPPHRAQVGWERDAREPRAGGRCRRHQGAELQAHRWAWSERGGREGGEGAHACAARGACCHGRCRRLCAVFQPPHHAAQQGEAGTPSCVRCVLQGPCAEGRAVPPALHLTSLR